MRCVHFLLLLTPLLSFDPSPKCTQRITQSPLDINFPLQTKSFDIRMEFLSPFQCFKIIKRENVIHFEGNFGFVQIDEIKINIKAINFVSPSLHSIANTQFGMELQFQAKNEFQSVLVIILFDEFQELDNPVLSLLGFGSSFYSNQPEVQKLNTNVNLHDFFKEDHQYFLYEGNYLFDECESTTIYVQKQTSYISS